MTNSTSKGNKARKENFGYQPDYNERGYQTDKSGTTTKKEPPTRTPKCGSSGEKAK